MRTLKCQDHQHEAVLAALRAAIDEGDASKNRSSETMSFEQFSNEASNST
jgi:hypothetical protein